jgi:hypothetical protein
MDRRTTWRHGHQSLVTTVDCSTSLDQHSRICKLVARARHTQLRGRALNNLLLHLQRAAHTPECTVFVSLLLLALLQQTCPAVLHRDELASASQVRRQDLQSNTHTKASMPRWQCQGVATQHHGAERYSKHIVLSQQNCYHLPCIQTHPAHRPGCSKYKQQDGHNLTRITVLQGTQLA